MSIFNLIPKEIRDEIFFYLDLKGFISASETSREWHNAIRINAFWFNFFPDLAENHRFMLKGFEIQEGYFENKPYVRSFKEINQLAHSFIENLQKDEMGIFQCLFPFNPHFFLSIKTRFHLQNNDRLSKKKEMTCVMVKKLPNYPTPFLHQDTASMVNYVALLTNYEESVQKNITTDQFALSIFFNAERTATKRKESLKPFYIRAKKHFIQTLTPNLEMAYRTAHSQIFLRYFS